MAELAVALEIAVDCLVSLLFFWPLCSRRLLDNRDAKKYSNPDRHKEEN